MESQKKYPQNISLEFFPPKSEQGAEKLRNVRSQLAVLNPSYISVTFGAGGSTQQGTLETVLEIKQAGIEAAPHMSCIGSSCKDLSKLLQTYIAHGIDRIVALRGDMPSGMQDRGELRYANELVEFIRSQTGDHFDIEVAAYPEFHPQATSAEKDLFNFKRKVEAGANSAITQYFYNTDAYYHFVDNCEAMGLDLPIVPGIMPITNFKQLARFSEMCGAEIPRWIYKRLEGFADDVASLRAFGLEVTTALCAELLQQGAPGLHFYTMNQAEPTVTICRRLGLVNG